MSLDSLVFLVSGGALVIIGMAMGRFLRPIGGDSRNQVQNGQTGEKSKMAHSCRMGCEQKFHGKVARQQHEENCNGGSETPDTQDTPHTGEAPREQPPKTS